MNQGHHGSAASAKSVLPADAGEALQWFVNTYGIYVGSTRGLFISDWTEEKAGNLEAAIINLRSRGFNPLAITGDAIFKQADYLWKESRANSQFGRPVASKLELDLGGSDIVVLDNLEAPENARQLWYLWSHLLYPRALSGKPTIITTPLSFQEFLKYGQACADPDYCAKSINWEKLLWLIEACMITVDGLKRTHEDGLPPMLKAEHQLYMALKERNIDVIPQHILGDFRLDFALMDKDHRLNIECDTISTLGSSELQRQEAKRNLMLFSDDWQVLKFTTAEILGNAAACVDVVDDVWRGGRKRGSTGRMLVGNVVPPMPDLPVDDDVQMNAITYGGGPAVVCGGAGTGKTTCLLQRVNYLIGQGVSPETILVVTHGTDTQRALKRAFEGMLEKQIAQRLNVCSWHDLGLKILKENLPAIKRKPPLKVEPSPQKIVQRLLAKAKKEIDPAKLELSVDLDEFYIAAVISMYKSHLISPAQAKQDASNYGEEIIAKIYQQLEDQLLKANRIDRDDVVGLSVQVLLDNAELRARYQRQFEFVLIDEYQDITVAQEMLGRLLAAPQDNIFIAGDEEETIHEAKNACPELFTEVSLRMPHARCFTLERNWRSHPAIVDHARQLISLLQKRRIHREYVSAWGQAPTTAIVGPAALADEYDEAQWIASEIQLLADSGRKFGEMAILFRHHVYATIIEEALDQKGVNFRASNPISNFVPDEAEDMLAFLKLIIDPDGPRARESFERVCQLRVKEIDPKLSATIASFAEANNLSYLKAVEIYAEATSDQACADLAQLVRTIRTMHADKWPPAEAIAQLRRTQRLNDYYRTVKVPAGVNYEPLKKLDQLEEESREFKTIVDFVKHIVDDKQGGADAGVQVLPIVESKGLEFPIVFMVGMAAGIFPAQTAVDLEEERRICYVGFTRAKELMYVSYPQQFAGAILAPSHFLLEAQLLTSMPPQPVYVPPPEPVYAPPPEPVYVAPEPVYAPPPEPVYVAPEPVYAPPPEPVYVAPPEPIYVAPEPDYSQPEPVYEATPEPVYEEPPYEEPPQQHVEPIYAQESIVAAGGSPLAPEPTDEAPIPEFPEDLPPVAEPAPEAPGKGSRQRPGRKGRAAAVPAEVAAEVPVEAPVLPDTVVPEPLPAAAASALVPEPEPVVSEPAVPEPAVSEPIVSEPIAAEPIAAEPVPAAVSPLVAETMLPEPHLPDEVAAAQPPVAAEPVAPSAPAVSELPVVPAEPLIPPAPAARPLSIVPSPIDLPQAFPETHRDPAANIAAFHAASKPFIEKEDRSKKKVEPVRAEEGELPAEPVAPSVVPGAPEQPAPSKLGAKELAARMRRKEAAAAERARQIGSRPAESGETLEPVETVAPSTPEAPHPEPVQPAVVEPAAEHELPAPEPALPAPEPALPAPEPALPPPTPLTAAQAAAAAHNSPAAPVDPFQVYTADQILQRPSMPSLPKRSSREPAAQPAAEIPGAPAAPAAPVPTPPAPVPPASIPSRPHIAPAAAYTAATPMSAAAPQSLEDQLYRNLAQQQPPVPMQRPGERKAQDDDPWGVEAQRAARRGQQPQQPVPPDEHRVEPVARSMEPPQAIQPAAPVYPTQPAAPQQPVYEQPYQQPHEQPYEQPAPVQPHQQPVEFAQPQPVYYEQPQFPFTQQQQSYQPHDMAAGQPLCPACHSALEPNARFCGECGYTLPQRIPACPTCSAPLEASAKFCGECGLELTGPVAGDSNQISANMVRMHDLKEKQQGWASKMWKMLE